MRPAIPGGRFQVPDVGLDRANQQGPVLVPLVAEHSRRELVVRPGRRGECPSRGPRHSRPSGARSSPDPQRVADQRLLGRSVRDGEPSAPAVLVDSCSPDSGPDPVAISEGVGESLQHDYTTPFAPSVPVGGCVESLTTAIRSESPHLGQADAGRRRKHEVHAPDKSQVDMALVQAPAGQVGRDERRRTSSIDSHARALQAEQIREPASSDAECIAGRDVRINVRETRRRQQLHVIAGIDPHVYPR